MPENLQEMPMDPSTGAVPMSPAEAPMLDPSMMGGQPQVDSEQEAGMRFDLERMLGKVDKKNAAFEEKQVLNSEKLEGLKAKIVREIFGLMKDLGVDPSDLNSINEFLQKLQQQDPDLYIMFESAINSLSSEGMASGMAPGMAPGMETAQAPGIPGMEAAPGIPGMEAAPGPVPIPAEEGGGSLMENNTTNLQENMLRQ
jgi:hypothetical protein